MDIQFDGFQNSIPSIVIMILLAGALVLSFWTYIHARGVSARSRIILSSLRFLCFLILILVLLNPLFIISEQLTVPARISLILDNSQSTTLVKGDYEGEQRYRQLVNGLLDPDGAVSEIEWDIFGFDADLFEIDPDDDLVSSLTLDGTRTDIDRALTSYLELHDGSEALILFTDGIVTSGRDPSMTATRIPVPVFTIGIGDTSRLNDIAVQSVAHVPAASINSRIPVDVSVRNDGFPNMDIPVQLWEGETLIGEETIRSASMRSVRQLRFTLELEQEGLRAFRIHIPETEGEWTTDNNTYYFNVDVSDDRIRILHLSYAIHPDVRALRRLLEEDKQISLETRTWISGDRYSEGALPDRADTLDLVILHGFPARQVPQDHARFVARQFADNALFVIAAPGQDLARLSSLLPGRLPVRHQENHAWFEVQPLFSAERADHPVLDFNRPDDLRLPPLRGSIGNVQTTSIADVLMESAYRGTPAGTPLVAVQTTSDYHTAFFNGYNFYRWMLSPREHTRDFWEKLFNNMTKWSAATPDEQLLDLRPLEPSFQIGEPVRFRAYLRNEAFLPEENGVIELSLSDHLEQERRYIMSNDGRGWYSLEMDHLPEGSYRYQGRATRGERVIDEREGEFVIGGVNREFIRTIRNDDLLSFIAGRTGGTFLPHNQADHLPELLAEEIGVAQRTETVSRTIMIHRNPFWFLLILLLLTIEWVIRKYKSID